ncbi:lysM and putative peptidoglycan-binding domain-containing protein 4 isoform X2 [Cylas formicarius]|uniref:lysM and putative peptidoglycan-binding domain-containing protein 4 isoform X2 n=1 Tax=Cylas formicarius TaxID=197179 RepID=UPI0029587373|nr:lysM and putative peptidoglycan-binding domain-containing protein 4 isoform X2 [Cylas formicarius]
MKRQRGLSKPNDNTTENTELTTRKTPKKPEVITVEKHVEDGDSLQSLAIRYQCTIEELKRINSIHKENEIYARKIIKVPYRSFTEALATVHSNAYNSSTDSSRSSTPLQTSELIKTGVSLVNNSLEVNNIIFNTNITSCAHYDSSDDLDQEANEEETLLSHETNVSEEPVIKSMKCSGSDWDISWPILIILFCILLLAIPFYVFYVAKQSELHNNHTKTNLVDHS